MGPRPLADSLARQPYRPTLHPHRQHLRPPEALERVVRGLHRGRWLRHHQPASALHPVENRAEGHRRAHAQPLRGFHRLPAPQPATPGNQNHRADPRHRPPHTLHPTGSAAGSVGASLGAQRARPRRCSRLRLQLFQDRPAHRACTAWRGADRRPQRHLEHRGPQSGRVDLLRLLPGRRGNPLETNEGQPEQLVPLLGRRHPAGRGLPHQSGGFRRPLQPPRPVAQRRKRQRPLRSGQHAPAH